MAGTAVIPLVRIPKKIGADSAWIAGAGVALLLLAVAMFDHRLLNDADTYWHLSAGEWMLRHRAVPHTDPFSFTSHGAPWVVQEWLAEIVMAIAFSLGGWNGVVALYGLSLAGTTLIMTNQLRRSLPALSVAIVLVLAFACIAPNLLARPHILVLPVLVGWAVVLLRAREAGRVPPIGSIGLMLLWANLHGSYVFGLVLLGAFALEAVVDSPAGERGRIWRGWALISLLAVIAAMITPQGPTGLLFPFKLMSMSSLAKIGEWQPTNFSGLSPFELALEATLFVTLSRGVKIPQIRLVLLLVLLHMALQHNRHVILAALVGAMVLAEPLGAAFQPTKPEAEPVGAGAWLMFGIGAFALIALRMAVPYVRSDDAVTPAAAIEHVPVALRAKPVLNEYGFGGYLIFRGIKPYIDSRADLYGDAFLEHYARIMRPDTAALDSTLRESHIAWTIQPPEGPLVAWLDARRDWKRLYADQFAVIHVRRP